jgi:putative acetyltransferase
MEAFEPARTLYAGFGFEPCERFGDYPDSPLSVCMTLPLA